MRKSKSSASGISLRTGEVDAGYFHDQFSWESPAVGRGSMKRAATETNLHDKTATPIAIKKNNFMRGPNSPSSATQQQSIAGGVTEKPEDGAYIWGLQLEGARFCKITHAVSDSHPRELYSALPLMHLSPVQNRPYTMSNIYRCPVYKTLLRAGILSTTGHSTNFVCWVELPSLEPTVFRDSLVSETNAAVKLADAEKWIKAGVALFCQLRF